MKIYRAETGKRIRVRKSFESLDELKAELEQLGDVPISSQILITSFGIPLKNNMLNEANKATGKDEYVIFLFDRELLDTNNAHNIKVLIEEPLLEPPINVSTPIAPVKLQKRSNLNNINLTEECGAYVNLFQTYHSQGKSIIKAAAAHVDFCERLYQEQKIQLMALGVAITNLDSHCRSVIDAHKDFYAFSEKEITKQSKLIKNLSTDIETLRRITIHPNMLKDAKNVTNDKESYTLGDFVTEEKLVILGKEGKQTYDQMSKRIQELTALVRSVQSGTETLREKNFDSFFPKMEESISNIKSYNNKLIQIAENLERDVRRVQEQVSKILDPNTKTTTTTKSIEAFEHLSDIQSQDYLPEMQNYDRYIREQVIFLVQCKNTMTTTLISNLQQISRLESSIAGIPGSLSRLDAEVRSKAQDYKSLNYVHQMPVAYAKTIVEIVRRKEYTKLILTKAQQIAEIMGHFRNIEQKRRESYRMDVKKYVPINIPALDDNPPPMCDISTANLKDDKLPSFTMEDIYSFSNFIGEIRPAIMSQASIYRSPIFTSSLSKTRPSQDDHLTTIQEILLKLARQIEGMNYEFDHIVGKTFLFEKNDNDKNGTSVSNPTTSILGRALPPPQQLGRRSKRISRQGYSEDSSPQIIDVNMDLIFEKTKQLDKAEEKIKAYEARIKSLENILHTNYKAAKNSSSSQSRLDMANSKTSMTSTLVSDEELAELRSRYKNLESSYTVEVNEKKKKEKIVNELESSYKNLEVSYKAIINEKETLLKRISELESRHQDSESSRAEAVKEIEERASNLEIRYQDIESSYTDVVNIKSSLEKKIEELKKNSEAVENSYALIVKEKETLSNEHLYLQNRFNELEVSYESSKERCNELETKITELEKVTFDNKRDDFLSGLEQRCQELESENDECEKKLDAMRYELERQTGILEAAKSNLKLTLAEKSELETRFDEYKQEFTGKENSYKQDQLKLKKKIEELETQKLNQEQIETVEELWKKRFEELQKEKDEQIKKLQKEKDEKVQEIQELQKESKESIKELQELQKEGYKRIQQLQKENDKKIQQLQKENDEKIQELQKENDEKIQELQMENEEKIQELQKENEEKVQEFQMENEEKVQQLQESEEKIRQLRKEYESSHNNYQHDIDGWKASLDKMHSAYDKCQKELDTTREKAKLAEEEISKRQAALEQVEKLIKNITEETVEYMPVVNSYLNSNEQNKLETSLNPINMIRKLGSIAISMSRELQDNKQLIEESKSDNEDLENSLKGISQKLNERTELSRLLSKYLWEYYNNLRTLMSAMGFSIPLKSEMPIAIISTEEKNSKSSESRLSDSYYAQDLGKFFSSDISNEPTEWPKDKYETLLTLSTKVDLNEVREMIRKTPKDAENLIKKFQQESKLNKDKYRKAKQESKEKIAFRNFKSGDLALFLPTRNSTAKPWAAFNINCPHYFLRTNENVANQIRNRDWVVAQVVNVTECLVDMKNPNTNPYDLPDGVKFYLLDVDGFMNNNSTTSNYSRKRADSESSFKPSRLNNMSASMPSIKDDDMSSSIADIPTKNIRKSTSRTYSTSATTTTPSLFNIFSFSSNGSETKENNPSSSDL